MTTYSCAACGEDVRYDAEAQVFVKPCAHDDCGVAAHLTATVTGKATMGQATDADH